jgi:DMSO/TMAO reductase YedYZ molybdopterin-dependent catalytic subunit
MEATVTVRGRSDLVLPAGFRGNDQFPLTSRRLQLAPLAGEPVSGRWSGVPVPTLLDAAQVPEQATHLLLEGANGYQAPVPMSRATDGLLAFERCDEVGMTPRFLAPGLEIRQCVCQLTSIEWLAIGDSTDPTTLATW